MKRYCGVDLGGTNIAAGIVDEEYQILTTASAPTPKGVDGVTLAAASSLEKGFEGSGGNKEGAHKVGLAIAERAKAKKIEEVVFDRGGFIYHGRVKELAEGAREGGLKF